LEDPFILFGRIEWRVSGVRLSVGNGRSGWWRRGFRKRRWLAGWVGPVSGSISGFDGGRLMAIRHHGEIITTHLYPIKHAITTGYYPPEDHELLDHI
jgi:hypothetical protein